MAPAKRHSSPPRDALRPYPRSAVASSLLQGRGTSASAAQALSVLVSPPSLLPLSNLKYRFTHSFRLLMPPTRTSPHRKRNQMFQWGRYVQTSETPNLNYHVEQAPSSSSLDTIQTTSTQTAQNPPQAIEGPIIQSTPEAQASFALDHWAGCD